MERPAAADTAGAERPVERAAADEAALDDLAACATATVPAFARVRVTVWAPPDVAEHFRDVVERVGELLGPEADVGQCVTWMLRRFAEVHWNLAVEKLMRRHALLDEGGWLCSAPHCRRRRHLEEHHVRFRSHGGSDAPSNRAPACWGCHHVVIHGGKMRVSGTAPDDLLFVVGEGPWKRAYRNDVRVPLDVEAGAEILDN